MLNAAPVRKKITVLRPPHKRQRLQEWESKFPRLQKPCADYRQPNNQFSVAVVPPRIYWGYIQGIRARHDRNYRRFYMPHITMTSPLPSFFTDEHMNEMLHRVRHAIKETEDSGHSEVIMDAAPKLFSFREEGLYTMHLRERDYREAGDPAKVQTSLEVLLMNLAKVFPEHPTGPSTIPHLTLGQWPDFKAAQHDLTLFSQSKTFNSMRWVLSHYVYIVRRQYVEFDETWRQVLYPESVTMTRCIPFAESFSLSKTDVGNII